MLFSFHFQVHYSVIYRLICKIYSSCSVPTVITAKWRCITRIHISSAKLSLERGKPTWTGCRKFKIKKKKKLFFFFWLVLFFVLFLFLFWESEMGNNAIVFTEHLLKFLWMDMFFKSCLTPAYCPLWMKKSLVRC